ncbi:MAG: hypothetical protein JOY54_20200 [Acidobacteriaceae bacterium]|nr:hypothetical protein [Acidobacteriaceae bacterium]
MRIKSYFAGSIEEAIEKAREELGSDAMLMNSTETERELRDLGAFEVVFGVVDNNGRLHSNGEANVPVMASLNLGTGSDFLVQELAELRKQLETISRSMARYSVKDPKFAPELEDAVIRLAAIGFSRETAEDLVECVESRLRSERDRLSRQLHDVKECFPRQVIDKALEARIGDRLTVCPELGKRGAKSRVVMLVGPPGAGKTATLVKLAVRFGLGTRTPVDIWTTDAFRVGAWEQLSKYARIANTSFETVGTVAALGTGLDRVGEGRLVLIDTPGYGPADMQEAFHWAAFVRRSEMDVHLVLPATTRGTVAKQISDRFAVFGPTKLILTRWDELEASGSAVELAMKADLALSFVGCGQQIPEDLRVACKAELLSDLLPNCKAAATTAA